MGSPMQFRKEHLKFDGEKLIELVRANECIYNAMDTRHRNREYVNQIWVNISEQMGISERACREKWTNMRSNYKRELRKLKEKQREEGDTNVRVTWPYFKHMSFLLPYFSASRRVSDNALPDFDDSVNMTDSVFEDNSGSVEDLVGDGEASGNSPPLALTYSRKRKAPYHNHSDMEVQYVQEPSGLCSTFLNDDDDDNKHFLLSLLPGMRKFTDEDNIIFRIEVQQLMRKLLFPSSSSKDS